MKKVVLYVILSFGLLCFPLIAQSADMVTDMIKTNEVTWAQAAYFAATWLNPEQNFTNGQEALDFLSSQNIISTKDPDSLITLQQLSGLCVRTWKIKGGLMYTLTKADRYAFRELKAKGIIDSSDDPSKKVTGRLALDVINSCSELNPTSGDAQ